MRLKIFVGVIVVVLLSVLFYATKSAETTDIHNWLTYKNEAHGYQFEYPEGFEVLTGDDSRLGFVEPPEKSAFIIFPAQYPNIKAINPGDPATFLNVTISVSPIGAPEQYGKTTEEVLKNFEAGLKPLVKVFKNKQGDTIGVYATGEFAYLVTKNTVYSFSVSGFNSEYKYVQDWLKNINNKKLNDSAEHFQDYVRILEGVYSTFKTIN